MKTNNKSCEQCLHKNICPKNKEQVCDHFKDRDLVLDLPCKIGSTVYLVEKECDKCPAFKETPFSDCVSCDRDCDLFEISIGSELCRQRLRVIGVPFKLGMIDQIGKSIFTCDKTARNYIAKLQEDCHEQNISESC